jgi:cyanophycin synthetase
VAGNKPFVYRLLRDGRLRVPEHEVFGLCELQRAEKFFWRNPKGCVVKPARGTSSGVGITTHVLTRREVRKAATLASLYDSQVLIEQMIPGESYRLLVLNGKFIHAVQRRGPRLKGNGVSSVEMLIRAENVRLTQKGEGALGLGRDCSFTLDYQNLSLSSIPAEGHEFLVSSVNDPGQRRVEVRTVYNSVVTDLVCDALKKDAESVAEALGSRFVGVDIVTVDPRIPLEQSGGAIIEANTTPGLHHHYDRQRERYPEPALLVLRALLSG